MGILGSSGTDVLVTESEVVWICLRVSHLLYVGARTFYPMVGVKLYKQDPILDGRDDMLHTVPGTCTAIKCPSDPINKTRVHAICLGGGGKKRDVATYPLL